MLKIHFFIVSSFWHFWSLPPTPHPPTRTHQYCSCLANLVVQRKADYQILHSSGKQIISTKCQYVTLTIDYPPDSTLRAGSQTTSISNCWIPAASHFLSSLGPPHNTNKHTQHTHTHTRTMNPPPRISQIFGKNTRIWGNFPNFDHTRKY